MPNKTINDKDNEDCRVLESFYTQYGTKLFVKDGVLVEQKLKSRPSSSAVPVDRKRKLVPVPSPYVGGFRRPVNNPSYSSDPPPPRKEFSLAEIKKLSYECSTETAQEALAHYNRKHPAKYALVRPIESNCFMRNGFWYHCVFLAKPVKGDGDSTERCFFAELKANGEKFGTTNYLVTFCRPIDGTQTTLGCEICDWMPHPLSGFLKGNLQVQPRLLRSSKVRSSVTRPSRPRSSVTRDSGSSDAMDVSGAKSGKRGEGGGGPGSSDAMDVSGAKAGKGGEGGGGCKKPTFCLKIQDLRKYIPNFDASDNEWMQYMSKA